MSVDLNSYARLLHSNLKQQSSSKLLLNLDYNSSLQTLIETLPLIQGNKGQLEYWSIIFLLKCESSGSCISTTNIENFINYLNWALYGALIVTNSEKNKLVAKCIDNILLNEFCNFDEENALYNALKLAEIVKIYEDHFENFNFFFKKQANIFLFSLWTKIKMFSEADIPGNDIKYVINQLLIAKRIGLYTKDMAYASAEFVFKYIQALSSNNLNITGKHKESKIIASAELLKNLEEICEDPDVRKEAKELKILLDNTLQPTPSEVPQTSSKPASSSSLDSGIYNFDKSLITVKKPARYMMPKGKLKISIFDGDMKGTPVCVKVYSSSTQQADLLKATKEIKIYEALSKLADNTNCFLKYYGTFLENGKINMVMEWYESNLMDYINHLKEIKFKFSEVQYLIVTYKLVSSFKTMADLGILHNDIKPHNMLIDDQWNIKIIDFDISLIKIQDVTFSATGYFPIQGTEGYISPEQRAALSAGQKTANFNREKADVYALGLVFYQLLTYKNVQNMTPEIIFNDIQNITEISKDTKKAIGKMLSVDPNTRPSFSEALAFFNMIPATRTFSNLH